MPVLDKKREIFRDIQVKREGYSSKKRGIIRRYADNDKSYDLHNCNTSLLEFIYTFMTYTGFYPGFYTRGEVRGQQDFSTVILTFDWWNSVKKISPSK